MVRIPFLPLPARYSSAAEEAGGDGDGEPFYISNCDNEPDQSNVHVINTGFMFMRGARALKLWTQTVWATHLEADPYRDYDGHEKLFEQYLVNMAMHSRRSDRPRLRHNCFPYELDGDKCRHDKGADEIGRPAHELTAATVAEHNPIFVHACCVSGYENKVQWLEKVSARRLATLDPL